MKQFHKEIKNVNKDLQYEELIKLFYDYSQTKSRVIRDQIFNANVKLVFSITKKFQLSEMDDLEQYGFIGLVNAIESFDPEKKNKFSTYATRSITNEIKRGLRQVNNIVTVPLAAQKKEDYTKPSSAF
ncbi:sigma-70 family RNA polymerase sigma factor [Flavobacterium sp. SORGH_AS_0622]|uniref:sigma-70 family RNA polymerase sigma factor n=1 Tax=Flavobacterium sp. SORGH_AS_0622 TaxID=3041772 RepID=UPI002787FC37|nr:sigma-70 family RNA polymerase sigma factor [Flavobacterium sp. SORGH_AS_0622]MDQ1165921.1 RNA polymerase sigma factor (sigma-70 family) [Flavobacterium sp. SORGH_AS_0622]